MNFDHKTSPLLALSSLTLTFVLACGFSLTAASVGDAAVAQEQHRSDLATLQFDVHPELQVELFASEPMMANPSNIDIDHLGRVWVCEVMNYRHFRNTDAKPREKGDRILILEDSDGDAVADTSTVFYQGRDIDSAHGICVLGDRAIVSANDSVFYLIDDDGDSKADRKEILFTGIGGTQHDHGIHAFVFGPDGKLYFNFGNEGKQIKDKNGSPITDVAGNVVDASNQPYNQGMVFRCNLDGSEFETLAWNFRNNWEVCVDSFGRLWQSDNDDDGNKSTRINFVIPFGDYGYKDQISGAGWQTPRTNMHSEIPKRHWYQNDPGVVPNMLETGAGSPTGICVYEGDGLPAIFRNQIIHCDAGPSIVRAYPIESFEAGYKAEIVNMVDGAEKNQWFRPSDVCVAPDGSLIVADWYDPGVGGHRMQDVERGRLFRVSQKGAPNSWPGALPDFSSPESATMALRSPNLATRYMAWTALADFDESSLESLTELWSDANPRMKARALWRIGKLDLEKEVKLKFIREALTDQEPELRCCAIRLCVQLRNELDLTDIQEQIDLNDSSPAVLREILIGLRQWRVEGAAEIWAAIADSYVPGERWMLESLGIAADGHWDEYLNAWSGDDASKLMTAAGKDIVWRSRGSKSAKLLTDTIVDAKTTSAELGRYFRAFDLLPANGMNEKLAALKLLAFSDMGLTLEKYNVALAESVSRLDVSTLSEKQKTRLASMVDASRDTPQFVDMVDKFSSQKHYGDLLDIASDAADRQLAADAMKVLMNKNQLGLVHSRFVRAQPDVRVTLGDAMLNCGHRKACHTLVGIAKRTDIESEIRIYAIKRLAQSRAGANDIIWWIDQKEKLDPVLQPAIAAALHSSDYPNIRKRAQELFPIAKSIDEEPLPAIANLLKLNGDVINGSKVFAGSGTCAKCHRVAGQGIEVGPDLSEIGSKLTKSATYESILFPSAGISHNYESWKVATEDGQIFTGVLISESDSEIQLKDKEGIRHSIALDEIDEKAKQELSLMPADLHRGMSKQDLVDLVEYMLSLKK